MPQPRRTKALMLRWWTVLAAAALVLGVAAAQESARPQRGKPPAPAAKPLTRPQGGKLDVNAFSERFTQTKIWRLHEDYRSGGPAGVFEKLDADSDGFVDGSEMRQLHQYLEKKQAQPGRRDSAEPPSSYVSESKHMQGVGEPLGIQKFRQKYEPLLDRMRVAEGGKSPEQIFAGLDENTNGIIDGKELQELAEKVGVALKTPRPAPDRGSGDEPDSAPDKGLDELIKKATEQGDQSPMQFEKMAKSSAKEMGKNAFQLFQELDLDKSGALSAEELKGYKSLLYTGKTHADRAGERTWRDHASRDPRKAPKVGKAGGNDLTFAEFEEMYKDQVTNEKQPHGHHKAFLALDRNEDNVLQPHELNALSRWIRSHPDL